VAAKPRPKKLTKQSRFAPVLAVSANAVFAGIVSCNAYESSAMRRILASRPAALALAACAIPLMIATEARAAGQLLDPGWQLGYVAPSRYGSGGGLIEQVFGDGGGPPAVAYQPAPMPYQPAPVPAPMYYQPRAAYAPAPVYYPQVALPQARAYRPAVVYYQPAPVYYQQAAVPQPRTYQRAPLASQQAQMPAPQPQPRVAQAAPQYTGSVQPPPSAAQPSPPPAPEPHRSIFQLTPFPAQASALPAPQPRVAQAPQYTGSVQPPPSAPQPAPEPHRSIFQLTPFPAQASTQTAPQPTPPLQLPQQSAAEPSPAPAPEPQRSFFQLTPPPQAVTYAEPAPAYAPSEYGDMAHPEIDPKYDRQVVDYHGSEPPGTIVVDTPHYLLYLVMEGGKAMRYGIGVGREGFTWSGTNEISAMREWPDWRPPNDMLERRPDLPRYMAGGPENPLGARALYIGSTLYRIHGSNEPWTIGTRVSSGCIRLRNADIMDLYERVKVGAKVVVL
jgi:lipoprotein-anchoring transpeptidase ErfK/SrfK